VVQRRVTPSVTIVGQKVFYFSRWFSLEKASLKRLRREGEPPQKGSLSPVMTNRGFLVISFVGGERENCGTKGR
jgi:hypothetical protein